MQSGESRRTEKDTDIAVNILLAQHKEIFEEGRMVIRSAHQFMFFIWVITGAIVGYGLASSNPSIVILIPLILTYALSAILHAFIDSRTRIRKNLNEIQQKILVVLENKYKQKDLFVSLKYIPEKRSDNIMLYSGVGCVVFLYLAAWMIGYNTFIITYPENFYDVSSKLIVNGLSLLYFIFFLILSIGMVKYVKL